jgi:hypothetical protein
MTDDVIGKSMAEATIRAPLAAIDRELGAS